MNLYGAKANKLSKRGRSEAIVRRLGVICGFALLAACTSVGQRTQLSVGYYIVEGQTFSQLDRQILLHGPNVDGVGKALAATNIRMVPDIHFAELGDQCVVKKARINVKAKVTLPRHGNLRSARSELRKAWNNLKRYAELHEAVHVAIADKFALKVEKAIQILEPQNNCDAMRSKVLEISKQIMLEHEEAQQKFDDDEQIRIKKLITKQENS